MRGIPLTRSNINASAIDAGNASMRKGCRATWNDDDARAANIVIVRLLPHYLAEQHGLTLRQAKAIVERDFATANTSEV